jgi:hypothetical protein
MLLNVAIAFSTPVGKRNGAVVSTCMRRVSLKAAVALDTPPRGYA